MYYKNIGNAQEGFFWQDNDKNEVIWRYENNPIIGRNRFKPNERIYNSGVEKFGDKFVGIFRCESTSGLPELRYGESNNGIDWVIDENPIDFIDENGNSWKSYYSYDPRLIKIENTYYIIWCTEFDGPTIVIAKTDDFKKYVKLPNGFLPCNRNGVLIPEKINGKYYMLSRPSDNGHTRFGDIFISESRDLVYWGNHKLLLRKSLNGEWWDSTKIGAGPAPIKTEAGWLMFYHGVASTCNGLVYCMSAALLDLDDPSKPLMKSNRILLEPQALYETVGYVSNVIFPCGVLCDKEGHISLYYGAADTVLAMAFTTTDKIISFIKETNALK